MGTQCKPSHIYKNGYLKFHSNGMVSIKYLVLGMCLLMKSTEAKSRVCTNFDSALHGGFYEETLPKTISRYCPPTVSPYNMYIVEDDQESITSGDEYSTLLVCWTTDVRRFALQFLDSVNLDTSTSAPVASLRACVVPNDTITHNHRHEVDGHKLLLNIPTASTTTTFRAYFDTKKVYAQHHHVVTYIFNKEETERSRRSVDDRQDVTDVSECGKSRSCVRYGTSDCGHFSCQYFLSTNVSGSDVDIELSAKTNGWAALGLSSDVKMGGDEVIACYRSDPAGSEVRAGTFQNPYSHDPAKPKSSDVVKLVHSKIQDGYLYCRLSRPESPSDHQDLSAKWFQLYGYGPVSQNGELEKHHVTPMVSDKMISLVHKYNIVGGGSIGMPSKCLVLLTAVLAAILEH